MAETSTGFIGLHLRNAYAFGKAKNLGNEVDEIRSLPIKKPRPQIKRRALFALLFESEGIYEDFLNAGNAGWPKGKTSRGRKSIINNKQALAKEYMALIKSPDDDGVVGYH